MIMIKSQTLDVTSKVKVCYMTLSLLKFGFCFSNNLLLAISSVNILPKLLNADVGPLSNCT